MTGTKVDRVQWAIDKLRTYGNIEISVLRSSSKSCTPYSVHIFTGERGSLAGWSVGETLPDALLSHLNKLHRLEETDALSPQTP